MHFDGLHFEGDPFAKLTLLCQMDFSIFINRMSPFPILGLFGDIFHIHSHFDRTFCKQTVETLIRHRILVSDLDLHCLPISHIKDARLIWVKVQFLLMLLKGCV